MRTGISLAIFLSMWALMSFSSDKNENSVKRHLFFEANSGDLTDRSIGQIDEWFEHISNNHLESVRITGFAGFMINTQNTKVLALIRAYRVQEYIKDKGVLEDKIEIDNIDASTLTCAEIPEGIEIEWRAEVEFVFKDEVPEFFKSE